MTDILKKLVGDGRGEYQRRDLVAALERGAAYYEASGKDLNGFKLPLFADVGTGKTPSTIVYINMVREYLRKKKDKRAESPVLYIVPASVKYNWLDEIKTWANPRPSDIWVIDGNPGERDQQLEFMKLLKPKFVIVNYDLVRIHQQTFQWLDKDGHHPFFLAVVCDEAHYIKWSERKRSVAVRSITAGFNVALTGTPLSNKPDSLWGVVAWLDNADTYDKTYKGKPPEPIHGICPLESWKQRNLIGRGDGCNGCEHWMSRKKTCKLYDRGKVGQKPFRDKVDSLTIRYRSRPPTWGSFDQFRLKYCSFSSWGYVSGANQRNMPELNDRLRRYGMIRWRRAEVIKAPKPQYEHVMLDPTPDQKTLYKRLREGFLMMYDGEDGYEPTRIRSILAQLMYFRRVTTMTPKEFSAAIAGHKPEFAPDLSIPISDKGAKQDWLVNFIDDQIIGNGDKLVVFSDWTGALRPLIRRLCKENKLDILVVRNKQLVPQGITKHPEGYISYIDSSVPKESRFILQQAWNTRQDIKVLLLSPAAFEGMNLQGGVGESDTVYGVFLNLPWLPKDVIQALGRIWRFGQKGQVVALFPALRGTIDETMSKVLRSKQSAFDEAIDGGEQDMAELFVVTSVRHILDLI